MVAAINFEGQCAGMGAVIRDNNSNFVVAAIKATKLHSDVAFVEAEAVSWGLDVAKHAGLSNILVESDSQDVIDLVNNRKSSRTKIQ